MKLSETLTDKSLTKKRNYKLSKRKNVWVKVEQVIKLLNAPTIIKVQFETAQMAKNSSGNRNAVIASVHSLKVYKKKILS